MSTAEPGGSDGLDNREVVHHSIKEFVRDQAHTNGIESLWARFKRGSVGTDHKRSKKPLGRYVQKFVECQTLREVDTLAQMLLVAGCGGKRLLSAALLADSAGFSQDAV